MFYHIIILHRHVSAATVTTVRCVF